VTHSSQPDAAKEMRMGLGHRSRERFGCLGLLLLVGACAPDAVIGLRPEYPPIGQLFPYGHEFVEVDSLQPTFRWESFPRKQDRMADKEGILSHLTSVTYDLQIWLAENGLPSARVYAKQGLTDTSHRINQPLARATMYFWTIRARFQINGESRVTEWGMSDWGPNRSRQRNLTTDFFPNPFYFRFRTPAR
jgi:hypothetical protein